MIDRLRLTNFQRHESLDLVLDSVTTIVGPTDAGKSSVLRALRWACLNRPRGDGFIMFGREDAEVKIRVDGQTVARTKGKAGNGYRLDDREYEAFSSDVPPDIAVLLKMDDRNFSLQHDQPYWFGLSAAEVARQLNRIVNLDEIDDVATRSSSLVRNLRGRESLVRERAAKAEESLAGLSWVPLARRGLASVAALENRARNASERLEGLLGALTGLRREDENIGKLARLLRVGDRVVEAGCRLKIIAGRTEALGSLVLEIRELSESILARKPDMIRIECLWAKTRDGYNKVAGLSKLLIELNGVEEVCRGKASAAEHAITELGEEVGGRCPICGREMS